MTKSSVADADQVLQQCIEKLKALKRRRAELAEDYATAAGKMATFEEQRDTYHKECRDKLGVEPDDLVGEIQTRSSKLLSDLQDKEKRMDAIEGADFGNGS